MKCLIRGPFGARGRGIEPLFCGPKPHVLPLDDPRRIPSKWASWKIPHVATHPFSLFSPFAADDGKNGNEGLRHPLRFGPEMGSLIKKRRKRMRKKKHKKMLKATRWQRRANK